MGADYRDIVGEIPDPLSLSFKPWVESLISYRTSEAPILRAVNYYFSQSGDDATGDGSEGDPWQTLVKAQATHDAASSDVGLFFKRGDVWEETAGLIISKPQFTVAAYGTGDRPLFNKFLIKYTSGVDWLPVAGDQYAAVEANYIEWLRYSGTRLTNILRRAASAAENLTLPDSWYYDSAGTALYINLGGLDPNNINLEAVVRNSTYGVVANNGADNFRIDSIEAHGWGMDSSATGNNIVGVALRPRDLETALATNCGSYFGGSHAMIHIVSGIGNGGGISTFSDCDAGYCMYNGSAGETIFNAFSQEGGNEIIYHNCTAAYGTLPSSDWITATRLKRGRSHYGHAGGTPLEPPKLCILYGGEIPDSTWGCFTFPSWGGLPLATTIQDCQGFIVDFTIPVANDSTTGSWSSNAAIINCTLELKRDHESAGCFSSAAPDYHYWVNCVLNADMSNQIVSFSVYNSTSSDNIMMWYHCFLKIRNLTNGTRNFAIDRDNIGLATPTGSSENSQFINSILDVQTNGVGYLGVNIQADRVYNNAFRGVTNTADVRGKSVNYVDITDDLGSGYTVADALAAGLARLGGPALGLRYDREWRVRDRNNPWIGPIEASAAGGGFRGRGRDHALWGCR